MYFETRRSIQHDRWLQTDSIYHIEATLPAASRGNLTFRHANSALRAPLQAPGLKKLTLRQLGLKAARIKAALS